MKISAHIDIAAPAEEVWTVMGPGFADVGRWAAAIPASRASTNEDGRVCSVEAMPGIDEVVERLTRYDDETRSLTYIADSGMPSYVSAAQNTWSVQPLGPGSSRAVMTAEVELSGVAVAAAPLARLALARIGRRTLRDLRHVVEHGVPSHRKQTQLARQAAAGAPVAMQTQRIIAAPAEEVWQAVADAADYSRFAAGIADTRTTGEGLGMVRSCTDDHGGTWSETCTLWEEGRRYRMTVDVSTYPLYYRALIQELSQTWLVEPVADGTRLTLTMDGRMRLGVLGRVVARILGRGRRLDAILQAYEADITARAPAAQDEPGACPAARRPAERPVDVSPYPRAAQISSARLNSASARGPLRSSCR